MSDISSLFKAYDLRGTVPVLTPEIYYLVAKGLVEKILQPEGLPLEVNLVRDGRYSSPDFYKAFYHGLIDSGAIVRALGMGTTDFMYAACQSLGASGAMITASHNPKDDNGCKMLKYGTHMLGLSTGLDKIRDYVVANLESTKLDLSQLSEVEENPEFQSKSLEYFIERAKTVGQTDLVNNLMKSQDKRLKIVVDTGNGMGGWIMPHFVDLYPNIEFVPLYWEVDGNFPNHPADPMVKANLVDLQNKIKEVGADFGAAFDGDADRCFIVDENGEPLNGEYLTAIFGKFMVELAYAKPELNLNPAVVYPLTYSRVICDTVIEANGAAVVSKQGHTFIKPIMAKYNAIYGGEPSGHHYFGLFGFMDSGLMSLALFIKIITDKNVPVSRLSDPYSSVYFVSGEHNFRLPVGLNINIIKDKIKARFNDATISELDGITVYYPTWKFTIRGSNTEPLIRVNVETKLENKAMEKLDELKTLIGI